MYHHRGGDRDRCDDGPSPRDQLSYDQGLDATAGNNNDLLLLVEGDVDSQALFETGDDNDPFQL